ncbi:MAG: toll/interleukin-1 receptor domain-containing protein [Cyclobacteriaceae bacterium]
MSQNGLSEEFQDQLEDLIEDIISGNVIPVVGSDLIKVRLTDEQRGQYNFDEGSGEIHFDNFLARKIQVDEDLILPDGSTKPELNDVLHAYMKKIAMDNQRLKPQVINKRLRRRVAQYISETFENYETNVSAFGKLAQIKPFKLYFNASITSLLRNELNKWRKNCNVYDFYPRFGPIRQDIRINESDYEELDHPILYNLFGDFSLGHFLLTENDFIEFVIDYHEGRNDLSNLQNLVDDPHDARTFLFLGCSFPNWLFRFFVRALSGRKLENLGLNIVVNDTLMDVDSARTLFFNRNRITYFQSIGPESLIDNIYSELKNNYPQLINIDKTQDIVFLSYASEDKALVHRIYEIMSHRDVDVWFDDRGGIDHGDDFSQRITDAMDRSSIIIPVLSKNSNSPDHSGRYYLREWQYAVELKNKKGVKINPVIIDDLMDNSPGHVPNEFWTLDYKKIESDMDFEQLAESIKNEQLKIRSNGVH